MRTLATTTLALLLTGLAGAAWADDDADEQIDRPAGAPAPGLGLDPSGLAVGDLVVPTPMAQSPSAAGAAGTGFHFHGFMRVPFRMGIGEGKDVPDGVKGGTKLHLPPRLADGDYTDWRYTNSLGGAWVELQLAYGNRNVAGTVSLAAYDVTDGSYGDPSAQLGINQAFVTLSYPELFGDVGGVVANVGVFTNRYGAAGRYSGGKYETFLIGATHVAGENVRAFFDVGERFTLHLEQGFGGKLNFVPFVSVADAPYLPYPGPEGQGGTLLTHGHAGVSWNDRLYLGGHVMHTWTQDADEPGEQDGKITNVGVDLKLTDSVAGDAYLGYSHMMTRNIMRLAGALEMLHSFQGWNYYDNYFAGSADGTGTVDSVMFQYTLSLARAIWHPRQFYGQGPDLLISAFTTMSFIGCDEEAFTGAEQKLKLGGELTYTPLKWLGISARWDLVQPDMDDNTQSFHAISPRIILRSNFISHEQIMIQYTGYVYGKEVSPTFPYEEADPDKHALMIAAIMWW